ncbi:MAG TPA: glucose-6-phosphate dehydrogenase assembly protein OpcA, partial [Thermoleophilaceae bacterium]|nr:glucose-6-phosphate dehydrogenase assembly protein OpcA [Thermoleophilaceae bacterium]
LSESGDVWQAQDTSPEEVAAALRELLKQRHAETEAFVPARVLNLVVIVDRDWRGEIQNRLDKVGSYHASRTILVSVEPGRTTIDASAAMTAEEEVKRGELAVAHEHVVLDIGEKHLKALDTIVDPLVVSDLATLVWSPHRHHEGVDAMAKLAQVILIDSQNTEGPEYAVKRSSELAQRHYVVDLAWLRSTPWRERVASTFDPAQWRRDLGSVSSVTVRHKPDSAMAGYLLLGWLSSRLGWEPGAMTEHAGGAQGKAKAHKHEIKLALEPDETMTTPGLAGITVESARGMSISLDRGPGGLTAHRQTPDGQDQTWTVTGASRGESGILGEGIRQALLRDHTYGPALAAAEQMLG